MNGPLAHAEWDLRVWLPVRWCAVRIALMKCLRIY
jgi:hypothetical protein